MRNDPRITRTEYQLAIKEVTVWDTGTYTCEIESDMEDQKFVSHFLQVLGKVYFSANQPGGFFS